MGNNYSWVCGEVVSWFCLSESIMMWNRTRSSSNLNSKAIQKILSLFQKSLFNMAQLPRDRALMETCCHTGVRLEGGACSYPVLASSSEHSCGRCAQVGELCPVTEFWEVSGLRSSRESKRERETLKATCFPWDRLDRQTAYVIQRILFPLSAWVNTVALRDRGQWFLPDVAGLSPLWLPHLPRCPPITGMRLCKWNWAITRTVIHPAWRCCWGWPMLCIKTASKKKKKGGSFSWESPLWREQKALYANQTHSLWKSAASLGLRFKTRRENFLPWMLPLIIILDWFFSCRQ